MQTAVPPHARNETGNPGGENRSADAERTGSAYARIESLLSEERCVILDGGTGTELGRRMPAAERAHDEALWGTWSLVHTPDAVRDVHRSYLDAGCDVISTNTWGLTSEMDPRGQTALAAPVHWMDIARRGLRTAREAVEAAGRTDEVAVALSVNGEVNSEARKELFELLPRAFDEDRPDLILLETIALLREGLSFEAIAALVETGIPVWTSFRRCRHGVCGVYGQHWGGPEGDEFGRAAHRLEAMGVAALLVNCLPPDHVPGMLPWLRDFTDLPLGVYPNLGYYTAEGWSFDRSVGGAEYAELAADWRAEGAQIIGGCCGVRSEHIEQLARVRELPVDRRRASSRTAGARRSPSTAGNAHSRDADPGAPAQLPRRPWLDGRGRRLFPLDLPEIVCEPGVFVPTPGSSLVWKYLFENALGKGLRCLDIGCGTGLLAIQLARNGAEHVHAIDIERRAVANTLSNAFRNGAAERVSGEAVDLYPWIPKERYELVVASLYQMPVDPYEQPNSHRPLDFWGRNLLDHLITKLPSLLTADGVAYVMQLSILSQARTADLLARAGFASRVVDFDLFSFNSLFAQRKEHIERVEELSDAYHVSFGGEDVMVAYLVEVTWAVPRSAGADHAADVPYPEQGPRSSRGAPAISPASTTSPSSSHAPETTNKEKNESR